MTSDETAALRATAHPLRLQILSILTGTAMSAAELARELGTTQANASYHLRVLAQAGEVVPDGEESIRGGVAKRYRHPWDQVRDPKAQPQNDHAQHVRSMGQELSRRWSARKPRTKAVLSDAEMWVEPETWARVVALVEEASGLIHASARPPRTDGHRARQPADRRVPDGGPVMSEAPRARAAARAELPLLLPLPAGQPGRRRDGQRRAGVRGAGGQRLRDRARHRARRAQHPDGACSCWRAA